VKTIEQQIGVPLETAFEEHFQDEEILTLTFNKKLASYSNSIEKRYTALLAQSISKHGTGKIKIKEICDFLKSIPGKYSQNDVLKMLAA